MSGILDSRTRIMDTIVTLEGRRQMADGKLRIEYVSFTDGSTFYDPDVVSGSADATNRIYFEQCHLPQDQITFEADDSGKLKPFKNKNNVNVISGKIFQTISGTNNLEFLTDSTFASAAQGLLTSSIDNFKNLQILSTKDSIFEDDDFQIGPTSISFDINDKTPISVVDPDLKSRSLQELPSLFNDESLSRVINFKYLPPINKIDSDLIVKSNPQVLEQNKIGNYENISPPEYNPANLEKDLLTYEKSGLKKTVKFDPTSLSNKIVCQFFEINSTEVKKLDVIDYGSFNSGGSIKQVFFVGKVFIDSFGSQTFVKLFTLLFE